MSENKVMLVCNADKVAPIFVESEQAEKLAKMDKGGGWRPATDSEKTKFQSDNASLTGVLSDPVAAPAPVAAPTSVKKASDKTS